jgi:glycosyltransferase involved in cell wall biosynthesis
MIEEQDGKSQHSLNRKLRVAILGSRGYPQTYSGYEVFVRELAPRLVARGHEMIVYCRRGLFKERPKYYNGVRLVYTPNIETKELGTFSHTLLSMIDVLFRQVDITLVVNISNAFHCIIPRLFGKRVAINVDGLDWKRDKWGPLAKKYFYWNARAVGRICPQGVITDAQEMRRIYLNEFDTPSACIAYGADLETTVDSGVVRQYGLEPFKYYLILSRMVPENNADLIVRAFERVRTSKVLAIAGDANYRSAFVDRLKRTTDSRVRFIGHIGNPAHVKELHANAYAYVHGHSLGGTNPSLLTALACRNCVLALNTPFNLEVLEDHGILFERDPLDLARKLQYVEDHPKHVAEYRNRAPHRILESYTWEKITDQYEELFLQLASGQDPTQVHSTVKQPYTAEQREPVVSSVAANR